MSANPGPGQARLHQAFIVAVYEYLLVAAPVGLYVTLEASSRDDAGFVARSPEWAIATIFVSFQMVSLYVRRLSETGQRVSQPFVGTISLLALFLVVAASINAYVSLRTESQLAVIFRRVLFALASAAFLLFVTSAEVARRRLRKH